MPFPVFEGAMTGVFAASATGWAPTAVFDSVGPMMPTTFPCWISVWNCWAPWDLSEASSRTSTAILARLTPVLLISSTASRIPLRCCGP